MLSKEVRKMSLENRIKILSEKGSESARIVNKLKRQLRNLEKEKIDE